MHYMIARSVKSPAKVGKHGFIHLSTGWFGNCISYHFTFRYCLNIKVTVKCQQLICLLGSMVNRIKVFYQEFKFLRL